MSTPLPDQIEQLSRHIEAAARPLARPLVVALDGRSGSGKSTLAATLAGRLGASVLEGDDFFSGGEAVSAAPPEDLAQICIDWRAQQEVLLVLRAGRPATYRAYDWAAFNGSRQLKETRVEPRPILLFEGVYSARPELRDLVDLAVCLDVPARERLRRLREREGEITPWEEQWHRAEDWYFAEQAPPARFDIVLGAGPAGP